MGPPSLVHWLCFGIAGDVHATESKRMASGCTTRNSALEWAEEVRNTGFPLLPSLSELLTIGACGALQGFAFLKFWIFALKTYFFFFFGENTVFTDDLLSWLANLHDIPV